MREVKKRVEQKTKTVGGEGQRAWKEGVGGGYPGGVAAPQVGSQH